MLSICRNCHVASGVPFQDRRDMTQPAPYARAFSFIGFQSGHPKTPLPGDKVDGELDAVAAATQRFAANLARLQRDDLALANNSLGYPS
ncbi:MULTISPECIES: hypothetical protein [unclassified Mesorhizobium]|uniref:hypothetical protein n=1 Tax=unclassified Mesorhizobium TaxID=325217 RepID=UPI00333D50DA